jgi:transmembrane sensor
MEASMINRSQHDHIADQAAMWVAELDELDAAQRAELAAWLMESPRHLEQFFLLSELDVQVDKASRLLKNPVPSVTGKEPNVVFLPASELPQSKSRFHKLPPMHRKAMLATAAVLVLALAGWLFATYPSWYGYATDIGELRAENLPDGSTVILNTASRLKVHYDGNERGVQLIGGEALFTVQRDARRPFRVYSDNAVIRVLGTQFNVHRRAHGTQVAVLDGAVSISDRLTHTAPPIELRAGSEVEISSSGNIAAITPLNNAKVTAWQQKRLHFKEDTLEEIAAEFNRYNREARIRLDDPAIADLRLSGVFDADAPESLLLFLQKINALSVERDGAEIRIRAAAD